MRLLGQSRRLAIEIGRRYVTEYGRRKSTRWMARSQDVRVSIGRRVVMETDPQGNGRDVVAPLLDRRQRMAVMSDRRSRAVGCVSDFRLRNASWRATVDFVGRLRRPEREGRGFCPLAKVRKDSRSQVIPTCERSFKSPAAIDDVGRCKHSHLRLCR